MIAPPNRRTGGTGVLVYHKGGGGAIGLYAAVLENAEGVLNETYGTLLESRSFIEDLLARKFRRSTRSGPDRTRIYELYVALRRWDSACRWFTKDDYGAVTMKQVFDIPAVDPDMKRNQLASRFNLPWPPEDVVEAMTFYYAPRKLILKRGSPHA